MSAAAMSRPMCPTTCSAGWARASPSDLTGEQPLCQGRAGLAAINGLATRLAKAADYPHPVSVRIVKGGPVNAFTLPGGILVFYSDLIDLDARRQRGGRRAGARDGSRHALSRDQGAGAAVRRRAAAEVDDRRLLRSRHRRRRAAACCWRCATAAASSATPTPPRVELLEKLGLRADGVSRFFERMLEKQPVDMASVIGIWSSHPPTAERIAATRRPATGRPPSATPNGRRCSRFAVDSRQPLGSPAFTLSGECPMRIP